MKKNMFRIIALTCVCIMLVCSFSFAAEIPEADVTSGRALTIPFTFGCSLSNTSAFAYTYSDYPGSISVSLDGMVKINGNSHYPRAGFNTGGTSAECYDSFEYATAGYIYGYHSFDGDTEMSGDRI